MRIRSITFFCNPGKNLSAMVLEEAGKFISRARVAYIEAGFDVQSTRIATIPFCQLVAANQVAGYATSLEKAVIAEGFEYLNLGPAQPDQPDGYAAIPSGLAATQHTFFSGLITRRSSSRSHQLSLTAARACAQVISESSTISPDGFANLRFAALANVTSHFPFFPAAYHDGEAPVFALAIEAAELAVKAFSEAHHIHEARKRLVESIEENAVRLEEVANRLAQETRITFSGLDFSFSPFPEESRSIGTAIERMGVPAVGMAGSLAATAILTETIKRARFTRTGFNGLMLPVLEDATLAARAGQGLLTVYDLLLYSSVCGTGVDTVPLPGDTPANHIASLLTDIAALSLRLDKPLTARLMPIPGKVAGDPTGFTFSYFTNSRILSLPAGSLHGILAGDEDLEIRSI